MKDWLSSRTGLFIGLVVGFILLQVTTNFNHHIYIDFGCIISLML